MLVVYEMGAYDSLQCFGYFKPFLNEGERDATNVSGRTRTWDVGGSWLTSHEQIWTFF